jgi:hypothetical protein
MPKSTARVDEGNVTTRMTILLTWTNALQSGESGRVPHPCSSRHLRYHWPRSQRRKLGRTPLTIKGYRIEFWSAEPLDCTGLTLNYSKRKVLNWTVDFLCFLVSKLHVLLLLLNSERLDHGMPAASNRDVRLYESGGCHPTA